MRVHYSSREQNCTICDNKQQIAFKSLKLPDLILHLDIYFSILNICELPNIFNISIQFNILNKCVILINIYIYYRKGV